LNRFKPTGLGDFHGLITDDPGLEPQGSSSRGDGGARDVGSELRPSKYVHYVDRPLYLRQDGYRWSSPKFGDVRIDRSDEIAAVVQEFRDAMAGAILLVG